MKDPLDDHGEHQIALATPPAGDQFGKLEMVDHIEHDLNVTVRYRAEDAQAVVRRDKPLSFEHATDQSNLLEWQMGDVGERAILDPSVLAIAFAEQIGRRRVAIGNPCHVHVYIIRVSFAQSIAT